MKKQICIGWILASLVGSSVLFSGCGNDEELGKLRQENSDLKSQVEQLQTENKDLQNQVAMYVPKNKKQVPAAQKEQSEQPVQLAEIKFDKSGVTEVDVVFKNTSNKTIDAVEFVILQFDNFGRPANRFNDPSHGNVTGKLNMQGNAAPGATIKGGWTLFNTEQTTKGKVVVKQVHFTDGAVWTNNNFDDEVANGKDHMDV